MKKTGRPSHYKPEYAEQVKKLCELGATDRELARFFKVGERTLNEWKIKYPAFSEGLKLGKDSADDRVVRSLYQRACGYEHPDVHVSNYEGQITLTPIIKKYPPDTSSCIFWLKNRRPDDWREKHEVEHTVKLADELKAARERAGITESPRPN